ncbi:MAG: methionine--tRNA ligase [Spirochaetota bacterium]|nr:methionine--tRNA ligase [Spirochaetota bacterium]
MTKEKYLVTSALPYANGPLHLGHVAGAYLPADIFVRYNKMKGNDIIYICGTDEYGVPITIKAEQNGVSPKKIVDEYHQLIAESFKKLRINFDNFSGTARLTHNTISQKFFTDLFENGYVSEKDSQQFYCEHDKMFLPDRFVEGVCPSCGHENARGDECPKCGKWLEPEKLKEPRCKLCSNSPKLRNTTHWYLRLDALQDKLEEWLKTKDNLKENVKKFAFGWIKEGLNERAITRDIKWGVPVPLKEAEGKVLYVWFDAPIGYISSTVEWSERLGAPDRWKDYWLDKDCKLIHFIGKDNVPFHIIVWPGILMGQNTEYILPHDVPANEHLTIEGHKLSTSEGNVVWVDDFLKHFSTDSLRYYLAAMAPETKDSDFSWKHFQEKNNSELNNVLGNLVNRTLTFLKRYFDGVVPERLALTEQDEANIAETKSYPKKVGELLSKFKVREAIFDVVQLAHIGNRYFDSQKPWELIKSDKERCGTVLNICHSMIKTIAPLIYPFLPDTGERLWKMVGMDSNVSEVLWDEIEELPVGTGSGISKVELLCPKIEDKAVNNVIEEFHKSIETTKGEPVDSEKKAEITIDDFHKVELKVGTVKECEKVEKSKKLLKLQVDLGDATRQILSGVAEHYQPEELIGRQVLVVCNLKKVKLMGIESEGMILFADCDGKLLLVSPQDPVEPGSEVG